MDAVQRYDRVKRSTVTISVNGSEVMNRDAIVIALREHDTLLLVNSYQIRLEDLIDVQFPSFNVASGGKVLGSGGGIAILSCLNRFEKQQDGLEEVELFRGHLEDFEEVHTYSHHLKYRVLSPGNIMSICDEEFRHSCSSHNITGYGSPVFNKNAQLAGMCFGFAQYLTSYNIIAIARKIDIMFKREFKSINLTFQNLRLEKVCETSSDSMSSSGTDVSSSSTDVPFAE